MLCFVCTASYFRKTNTPGKKKAAVFPGREEASSASWGEKPGLLQTSPAVTSQPGPAPSGSAGPAEHAPVPGTISKTSGAAVHRGRPIERHGVGQLITLSAINATMGYRGNPVLWCIQAAICTRLPRPLGTCCCRIGLDKWLSLSGSKQACPSPLSFTPLLEKSTASVKLTQKSGDSATAPALMITEPLLCLFTASPVAQLVKHPLAMGEAWVQSLGWEDPWRREWLPTPVFWPGEFHGLYIVHGVPKNWTRLRNFHFHFGDSDGKESACNARDQSSIPGSGRSPGEGNGHPLQYSCLGNSMDRGAWQVTVHGIAKGLAQLSD